MNNYNIMLAHINNEDVNSPTFSLLITFKITQKIILTCQTQMYPFSQLDTLDFQIVIIVNFIHAYNND